MVYFYAKISGKFSIESFSFETHNCKDYGITVSLHYYSAVEQNILLIYGQCNLFFFDIFP